MSVDIHAGCVSSLLHMDGTHGGTTFTDESGKTVTVSGSATTTTSSYKYGTAAGDFPGGGSDRLSLAAHDDFNLGTGSWTIECWFKTNNPTVQYMTLIEKDDASFTAGSWTLYLNYASSSAGDIAFATRDFSAIGTPIVYSTSGAFDDNSWHHAAVTRNGNWYMLWVDGVLKDVETSTTGITDLSTSVYIGNSKYASRGFVGQMDEVRITKGVARYTTGFTVPPGAFGNDYPNGGDDVGATGFQGAPGTTIFGPQGPDGEGQPATLVLPSPPPRYDANDQRQVRQLVQRAFR